MKLKFNKFKMDWGKQEYLKVIGCFIAALIIMLPIYSAEVYAANVNIAQSHGTDKLSGFLDGEGDVWTVKAIANLDDGEEVSPEMVKLKIAGQKFDFSSCATSIGGHECSIEKDFSQGFANSGQHIFEVLLFDNNDEQVTSDKDSIKIDKEGPEILTALFAQKSEGIQVVFTITDPFPCYELGSIEIIEGATVIETITQFDSKCSHNDNILMDYDSGDSGVKYFKIRAKDVFGHTTTSDSVPLSVDFTAPEIDGNSVVFVGAEEGFVGQTEYVDVLVNVTEESDLEIVYIDSVDMDLEEEEMDCDFDDQEGVYSCELESVEFSTKESVSFEIVAIDDSGNKATYSGSKSLTLDQTAPELVSFGTKVNYLGANLVGEGKNEFVAVFTESESGMDANSVKGDFSNIGSGSSVVASSCNQTSEGSSEWECAWEEISVSANKFNDDEGQEVFLNSFYADKVGNKNDYVEKIEVFLDDMDPELKSLEIRGISDLGAQDFFHSGDILEIQMNIEEDNGLILNMDVNDLYTEIPDQYVDGYFEADESNYCQQEDLKWKCTVELEQIRSGPTKAEIVFEVTDTAGNPVSVPSFGEEKDKVFGKSNAASCAVIDGGAKITCNLEILGLQEETDPDFWTVSKPKTSGFIDIGVTNLIKPRINFDLEFDSDIATLKNVEVGKCETDDFNYHSKEYLFFNPDTGDAELILEMDPFDGASYFEDQIEEKQQYGSVTYVYVDYVCELKFFSSVGKKVVPVAEKKDVEIQVPFAFTQSGSFEDDLEQKIKDARDIAESGAWSWIDEVQTVIDWVNNINNLVVQPIKDLLAIVDIIKVLIGFYEDTNPATKKSLQKVCKTGTKAQETLWGIIDVVDGILAILACSEKAGDGTFLSFLGAWHGMVLDWYNTLLLLNFDKTETNFLEGATAVGGKKPHEAGNLNDNILVATVGLCLPGIIYNIHKMREITCRYVYCLENEVATGIPSTVCDELKSQMWCKYFVGELMEMAPFLRTADIILGLLEGLISDWIGTAISLLSYFCKKLCDVNSTLAGICSAFKILAKMWNIYNGIVAALAQQETIGQSYCALIEE
jgi:hypothetical protein